jgi:hypothetical protein
MLHRESPVLLSDGMTYAGPRFHPRPSDDPYVVLQWRLSSYSPFYRIGVSRPAPRYGCQQRVCPIVGSTMKVFVGSNRKINVA